MGIAALALVVLSPLALLTVFDLLAGRWDDGIHGWWANRAMAPSTVAT